MTDSPELSFEMLASDSPVPAAQRAQVMAEPGFGSVFTDHMTTIRWSEDRGWHDARLEPYGPIVLDPASAVLHYGQEIFEGLKAYAQPGGRVVSFRPQANAARFNRSADRLAMPSLPEDVFVRAIEVLVGRDRDWVPTAEGHSLYLRPFMIATQTGLGVNKPSGSYLFPVIASPVAGYFGGAKAVSVWLSDDYTRAAPGGTGEAKCGGNYAASFAGQRLAVANGCDQVVWLDAAERRWVEEMGGMNLFFVYGSGADARMMDPGPRPARCCTGSPGTRCSSSAPTWASRLTRARSRSRTGGRAAPRAISPRSSPAAPRPSSPRSGRCAAPAATGWSATARRARSPCGCARNWSASRPAPARTPTAGSTPSSSRSRNRITTSRPAVALARLPGGRACR